MNEGKVQKAMTYREWIIEHWELGSPYRRAKENVERCRKDIRILEEQIAAAERGDTPDHPFFREMPSSGLLSSVFEIMTDSIHANMLGITPSELQQKRWEEEALEAEAKRKEKLDFFLRHYRDGTDDSGYFIDQFESLQALGMELRKAEARLDDCKPTPVHDWSKRPRLNMVGNTWDNDVWDDYEKRRDAWGLANEQILLDMLSTFARQPKYIRTDPNDDLAGFIGDLGDYWDFSCALWAPPMRRITFSVSNSIVPGAKCTRRGDFWDAPLLAMLDFINENWERLYDALGPAKRNDDMQDEQAA